MSTSDAAELELRVVGGGETPPPLYRTATRTATSREQKNETFRETPTGQRCHPSAIRQKETDKAQILRADKLRREEASCCGDPKVQNQKPIGSSLTSCLLFRLSGNQGLEKPELRLKKILDSCPHSLTETKCDESENSRCQVNGQTSPPDTSVEVASNSASSERIPAKKKEEVITAVCHNFSNGEFVQHECNDLCIHPCASNSRTGSKSVDVEDIKDHTKLEKQTDFVELSNPIRAMLSSSVVTVLAPHWSGRLRRTKRSDAAGNLEAQGNFQDVVNTAAYDTHQHSQDGSQAHLRVPFLVTRKNSLDWSAKSGPARLDYESKRKMIQTVSLDVNSGKMDKREKDAGSSRPVARTVSSVSSHSLDLNEQRRNLQTGHEGLSSLSSKPTSSSLLLSLRRFNSNGRIPNAASTVTEVNPSPLNSSPTDQDGQLFATHLSQNFHNNNAQDMSKPLLSPSTSSYGTTETRPILSPSSSSHGERTLFETRLFSASLTNKDTEDLQKITQQPQSANRAHPNLSSSKQAFLTREPSERQVNCRGSDKSTNLLSESSVSSTRHSLYDHSPLLKTHSLPRPTLTSSSWWKQVTQEGSSSLKLNDKASIADKPNTPHNDKSDLPSPSPTNNKRFSGQVLDNRDNNNTIESVCKGNMNLVKKTQGGTHSLKQRNAEDSPDDESNRLVKQKYDSNLNIREPQKPHSLPGNLSSSKNGRVAAQTIVCHPHDLTKHNLSNSSFTENITKLQPTFLNPKNSNTPTETCSKYIDNHYASKTNSIPPFLHKKETQILSKPSPIVSTSTLNSQAKTSSSFLSDPVSTQTNIHASSYIGSSYQTPKFTTTTNTSPLGFERTYNSIPKPFRPKTVSSLIPTVSDLSKSNYSPLSTASTVSSCTTGSPPAAKTVPSPSLLTTPVTPATSALASSPTTVTSSLLTPPDTPIITSPNYSDTSSPKEGRTFSNSQDRDTKEGKRARRVSWQDSVNVPCSEPMTAEMPELMSSPSPSRSPQRIKAPSIFSLLRSNSPPKNTHRLCSCSPKTSSIQVVKGERYRSLSSDSADLAARERERSQQRFSDTMISHQDRRDLTTPRQERALSVESGTVHGHSSAPLSLPPDFSSGYKLRYSAPPYSTLMSTRSAQGETKTMTPRSTLSQEPTQSIYTPYISTHNDPNEGMTSQMPRLPWSTISLPQPLSLPFKTKTATRESSKCGVSETDKLNNNHGRDKSQDCQNGQIVLVNNRVHVRSQSLQGDKVDSYPSTFVTETLVYSIRSKVDTATAVPKNTTPKQHTRSSLASQETNLSQQSHIVQSKETTRHSDQGFSGRSSTESQPSNRRMKETVVGKSRFFSIESNNEQSPKKSRFALKKSVSTPNSSLSRSESDRASKTNNKMDQVLNRLRQTFSSRRSEDDSSFPWKRKRASQTPVSDINIVSDITVESSKSLVKQEEEGVVLKDKDKETEVANAWTQNRYTLTTTSASGKPTARDKFSIISGKLTLDTDQDKQNSCPEPMSQKQSQLMHSPATHQFEFYRDNGTDYKPTNQILSCRDPSPGRSPNPSAVYPSQFSKSSSSPRSPFSPFSSLSPLSVFPPPDVTDDNVLYSPKLQRRRDSSSPCEPGEGISLGGSRRSRVSTGPPSPGPGQDKQCFASSYADLKYGIEPGRSFSVSSVLSSRPSGPGRISTGSRFMSVGDLYESALTCGGTGKDLDHWSVSPDWTTEYDCQPSKDWCMSYFPGNTGKMRSRSLPRSLTRRLANWTSGVSGSPPDGNKTSKPAHLWSPCDFTWDTESPPTPPPTPPLSPVSRRMSTPPGNSSPTFPSSSGSPQQAENQTSRGHLPSRGYRSSLSTFEEFSDCSSDTTTDDEYYLETGEDEEKETEL